MADAVDAVEAGVENPRSDAAERDVDVDVVDNSRIQALIDTTNKEIIDLAKEYREDPQYQLPVKIMINRIQYENESGIKYVNRLYEKEEVILVNESLKAHILTTNIDSQSNYKNAYTTIGFTYKDKTKYYSSLTAFVNDFRNKKIDVNDIVQDSIVIYVLTLVIGKNDDPRNFINYPKTYGIIKNSYNVDKLTLEDQPIFDTLQWKSGSCWFDCALTSTFIIDNNFGRFILNTYLSKSEEDQKKNILLNQLIDSIKSKTKKYSIHDNITDYLVELCDNSIEDNKDVGLGGDNLTFCERVKLKGWNESHPSFRLLYQSVSDLGEKGSLVLGDENFGLGIGTWLGNTGDGDFITSVGNARIVDDELVKSGCLLLWGKILNKSQSGGVQYTMFDGEAGSTKQDIRTITNNGINYKLKSFTIETGGQRGGHYTTVILANNKVFEIDISPAGSNKIKEITTNDEDIIFDRTNEDSVYIYDRIDQGRQIEGGQYGGNPRDRMFTFPDFGIIENDIPDVGNVGLMILDYNNKTSQEQAQKINQLIINISKDERYEKIGLTYSANSEQCRNIFDDESSNGLEYITGSNQAEVLQDLSNIDKATPGQLNKLKIIPFTTMPEGDSSAAPELKDVVECIQNACEFVKNKKNMLLVWCNSSYTSFGPALGGGVANSEVQKKYIRNYKKLFVTATQPLYINDNISREIFDIQLTIDGDKSGKARFHGFNRPPIIEDFFDNPEFNDGNVNFEKDDITCDRIPTDTDTESVDLGSYKPLEIRETDLTKKAINEIEQLFQGDDSLKNILGAYGTPKRTEYRGFINDYRRFIEYSSKDSSIGIISRNNRISDDDPNRTKLPIMLGRVFDDVWTFKHPLDDTSITKRNMNFFLGISHSTNLALEIYESRPIFRSNMLVQDPTDIANIGNVKFSTTEFSKTLYRCIEYQLRTPAGREELQKMINFKIELLRKILNEIKINTDKLQEDVTRTLETISPIEFDITQESDIFRNVKLERNKEQSIDNLRQSDPRFTGSKESSGDKPTPTSSPTKPSEPKQSIKIESGFIDKK